MSKIENRGKLSSERAEKTEVVVRNPVSRFGCFGQAEQKILRTDFLQWKFFFQKVTLSQLSASFVLFATDLNTFSAKLNNQSNVRWKKVNIFISVCW